MRSLFQTRAEYILSYGMRRRSIMVGEIVKGGTV